MKYIYSTIYYILVFTYLLHTSTIGHPGNERADQLAREAVKNAMSIINTPPSWATYKQAIKAKIYDEWEHRWTNDNAYRMTKIFFPSPHSNKDKIILKLCRPDLRTLVEIITGQNNLNYMNNKVYGTEELCR